MIAPLIESVAALFKPKQTPRVHSETLLRQIEYIKEQKQQNDILFDMADDEDLIEACIYEGKALEAYTQYLHKLAKREEGRHPPQVVWEEEKEGGLVG